MNLVRVLVPRFRRLDSAMQERAAYAAMRVEDRDADRLERLNRVWAKAVRSTAYYRALAAEHGLAGQFRSLDEFKATVPVTCRRTVNADPAAFRTQDRARGRWQCTSGSTGRPTRVFWAHKAHLESLRDQYWARTWWGIEPFDRQAMLWGGGGRSDSGLDRTCRRIAIRIGDWLRCRQRFEAHRLDSARLRQIYDAIARTRPESLYAYASAAYLLAQANADRSAGGPRLKAAFLSAEPILPRYETAIREVFGCPCVGEYGSTDCGLIAHQRRGSDYEVFERSVLVETVPAEGGHAILVTQLRDTAFPLFRYALGDMTSRPISRNDAGRETLHDIIGRSHDLIRTPSGVVYHGTLIEAIVEEAPEIVLFQVVQRHDYSLDIFVLCRDQRPLASEQEARIQEQIAAVLGSEIGIRICPEERIKPRKSGKHGYIVSELIDPESPDLLALPPAPSAGQAPSV